MLEICLTDLPKGWHFFFPQQQLCKMKICSGCWFFFFPFPFFFFPKEYVVKGWEENLWFGENKWFLSTGGGERKKFLTKMIQQVLSHIPCNKKTKYRMKDGNSWTHSPSHIVCHVMSGVILITRTMWSIFGENHTDIDFVCGGGSVHL